MIKSLLKEYVALLPDNASYEEIQKAYKALALYYHPDKYPTERKAWAEEKMKHLNQAREMLSDPGRMESYIKQLRAHKNRQSNLANSLQRENTSLKKRLDTSLQEKTVLGLAVLLLGGALILQNQPASNRGGRNNLFNG